MDLAGLLALLRRQWILVGVIMLVAGTSSYVTWSQATPSYRANATLSVLPPRVNVEGVPRNPYLEIASASNADIAQRLSIQLNGTDWRRRLTSEGFSPDYLVDHGDATTPVLRINIETGDPELSEATLVAVMDGLAEQLASQQERFDINQRSRFTIDTLDRSPGATRVFGNRTRLTGAILVLGGIAAVIAAQGLDNFQRRRREEDEPEAPQSRQDNQRGVGVWIPRPNVESRPMATSAAGQGGQPTPPAPPSDRGRAGNNEPGRLWTRSGDNQTGSGSGFADGQYPNESSRLVVKSSGATVTNEVPSQGPGSENLWERD